MPPVQAVVTTGIYCRPECTARPSPTNVRPYGSAAAAEAAGYRACLRCRPYRSPTEPGWMGPELVCRAVQLILDGTLDDGTEADLANRLAVSPRHLRRLFVDHVGATPDQLARSRRAHFARRLLDDTDLDITEVAFASGFGSVRQFNRTMTAVFRDTPAALRQRRRSTDRMVADGGLRLRLTYDGPYDWSAALAYLGGRVIAGVEHVDGTTYRRTVSIDGDPGVIEVGPGGHDHLLLTAHLPHWEGLIHVVRRVRRMLALDVEQIAAVHHLADDPIVGPLASRRPGARLPGAWDPFEIGVRAIVGQQVSVAGANTVAARLVRRHGTEVPGLDSLGLSHLFPAPERLAAPTTDLEGIGLTGARTAAIRAFAAAVVAGEIRFDRSQPLDTFVASVVAIPGLGPWTANYLALRLGERDGFPSTDLGIKRGAERVLEATLTYPELAAIAEAWRPWRSLAALHLWLADSDRTPATSST